MNQQQDEVKVEQTLPKTKSSQVKFNEVISFSKKRSTYNPELKFRVSTSMRMNMRFSKTQGKFMFKQNLESIAQRHQYKNPQNYSMCQNLCEICQFKMTNRDENIFLSRCAHSMNFCEDCLLNYALYKIQNYQEVYCLRQQCQETIEVSGILFSMLSPEIQKRYRKIQRFQKVKKEPNSKLCPEQNCQGIIRLTNQNVMLCDECQISYCQHCLLPAHKDDCQSRQLSFFENNMKFKQCSKCRVIIQKQQGCDHIKCICGFQFCYVCGQSWSPWHYQDHDQQGNLLLFRPQRQEIDLSYNIDWWACRLTACPWDQQCCINCQKVWMCKLCEGLRLDSLIKKNIFCQVFKFLAKLVLYTLYTILMLIVFSKDVLAIVYLIILALFRGIFEYSYKKFAHFSLTLKILVIVCFPVYLIFGIMAAIKETFWKSLVRLEKLNCQNFQRGFDCIWGL